jgi:purine-binding chemotaxis protein CheW
MENGNERRLITICVGRELYAIDIFSIDSIIKPVKITPVPLVEDFFLGVINMRGTVIPVISMQKKLGFEEDPMDENSRILVLRSEEGELIGAMTDAVNDVIVVKEENYSEDLSENLRNRAFISGVVRDENQLITVLNMNALLGSLTAEA